MYQSAQNPRGKNSGANVSVWVNETHIHANKMTPNDTNSEYTFTPTDRHDHANISTTLTNTHIHTSLLWFAAEVLEDGGEVGRVAVDEEDVVLREVAARRGGEERRRLPRERQRGRRERRAACGGGGRGGKKVYRKREAPDHRKKGWFERSTYGERGHRTITFC